MATHQPKSTRSTPKRSSSPDPDRPYISRGNLRMDCPTFSLPSHTTCPNSTPHCRTYCYAAKAERMYRGVLLSRQRNLRSTLSPLFVEQMVSQIKNGMFRIHESGEFYSQDYLNKWFEIVGQCPNTKFLVYSNRWDLDWEHKPSNMIVYWSIWDDSDHARVPERGLRAYVVDDGRKKIGDSGAGVDVKECTKGHEGGVKKCNECMWCFDGRGDVKFRIH